MGKGFDVVDLQFYSWYLAILCRNIMSKLRSKFSYKLMAAPELDAVPNSYLQVCRWVLLVYWLPQHTLYQGLCACGITLDISDTPWRGGSCECSENGDIFLGILRAMLGLIGSLLCKCIFDPWVRRETCIWLMVLCSVWCRCQCSAFPKAPQVQTRIDHTTLKLPRACSRRNMVSPWKIQINKTATGLGHLHRFAVQ